MFWKPAIVFIETFYKNQILYLICLDSERLTFIWTSSDLFDQTTRWFPPEHEAFQIKTLTCFYSLKFFGFKS